MPEKSKKSLSERFDEKIFENMQRKFEVMEQALANLIGQLGEGYPKVLADISTQEHNALSVALAYANWLESDLLKSYVIDFLRLSPARKGKRAKQLTQIGVASRGTTDSDDGITAKLKRMLRIGTG